VAEKFNLLSPMSSGLPIYKISCYAVFCHYQEKCRKAYIKISGLFFHPMRMEKIDQQIEFACVQFKCSRMSADSNREEKPQRSCSAMKSLFFSAYG
jgi:hypothetical protein